MSTSKAPNTPALCLVAWNQRPRLEHEEVRLLRLRVAYACIDWFWEEHMQCINLKALPMRMLTYIDTLRNDGFVHPVYWEIIRCLKEIASGTKRHLVYDDVRYNRRRRAVHKLITPRMRS